MADQQYDNEMRGVLFKNDQKTSDKHPEYKGQCQINGVEMWVSAWVKRSKRDNKPYMSLSFELKEGQSFGTAEIPIDTSDFQTGGGGTSLPADDDIPF